jgi:hypothetical protein
MHMVTQFLFVKGFTVVEIICQLMEVCRACVTWKQVCIWCSAFDNSMADIDDKKCNHPLQPAWLWFALLLLVLHEICLSREYLQGNIQPTLIPTFVIL